MGKSSNLRFSTFRWDAQSQTFKVNDNDFADKHGNLEAPLQVTTTASAASGSCGVQFVFKDIGGNALTAPVSGLCYLSTSASGLTHNLANTSFAVLTNGALTNIGGAGPSLFTTTATGLLGITITASAGSYYVVFVLPSGRLLISSVCTVS